MLSIFVRVPKKVESNWMEIIKASYPEGQNLPSSRIVICDLHFDGEDILKKAGKTVLKEGALPKHLYVIFHFCLFN